jgi:protein tyrosine phosphatase (PTP) superfamily phosphohydrolase (DUF442 family)
MSNYFIDHIINFAPVNEHITTSGQPDHSAFPLIKSAGYQMVIYLATSASSNHIAEEPQIVRELGMQYIHIPVIWDSPQPTQFEEFSNILEQNKDKNIFIHCALNYRVSSFIFLYQVLFLNADPESAWWSMLEIWDPNLIWRDFMKTILEQHHAAPFERL